jgi:hypothetical protein
MDEILTCKKCKKFFSEPISLPCGKQMCKEHLYEASSDNFNCGLCASQHEIPENGYAIIESINKALNLNLHLDEKGKEAKKLILSLENLVRDFNLVNNDPENFIFDYVASIRNSIDLERERLIFEIHKISDDMLNSLKSFENECKSNLKNLGSLIEQNRWLIKDLERACSDYKEDIREPNMSAEQTKKLIDDVGSHLKSGQKPLDELKNHLLVGKSCTFKSKNLTINQNLIVEFNLIESKYECLTIPITNDVDSKREDAIQKIDMNNSLILTNKQAEDLVKLCKLTSHKFELIYRASRDGFKSADFHSKCDGITDTLTIVKAKGNSNIFGGFTGASWDCSNKFKIDKSAFLFSLVNKYGTPVRVEIDPKFPDSAIFCGSFYGPCFGLSDLYLSSDSNKNQDSFSNFSFIYKYPQEEESVVGLLSGSYCFTTSEIEVYKLK